MKAGIYNENNELIKSWEELIVRETIKIYGNAILSCRSFISGKLIIPEGIIKISESAFEGCCFLTEIEIPNSVTEIGRGAFFECSNLKKIKIPTKVKVIEPYAFSRCTELKDIEIPNNIEKISKGIFINCTSLTRINIPKGTKKIELFAFYECKSIKEIKYPGTEEEFKKIEGWEHIFDNNNLTIDDVIFEKTLEDLIKEGYTLTEANRELKQQKEER